MPPGPGETNETARLTERNELAARQLGLVTALVARGAPPAGVDPGRVRIQATALIRKRSRSVASRAPALAAALGADFWPAFQDYDATRAGPLPAGPAADTRDFARFLTTAAAAAHATPEVRRAVRSTGVASPVTGRRLARWLTGAVGRAGMAQAAVRALGSR